MINKFMTADEAVAGVKDGMTIMVGGFLGTGSPEVLMDAQMCIRDSFIADTRVVCGSFEGICKGCQSDGQSAGSGTGYTSHDR